MSIDKFTFIMFSDDYSLDTAIFQEPPGYFKAEAPGSYEEFTLLSGQALRLRLVGHNPLWVALYIILKAMVDFLIHPIVGTSSLEWCEIYLGVPSATCRKHSSTQECA